MIEKLVIAQFKKHEHLKLDIGKKNVVLLYGDNASGKTSILEAISLFSPGKGLFHSSYKDLIKRGNDSFEIKLFDDSIGNIIFFNNEKIITINETKKKGIELLDFWRIYGVIPYISLAFWKDSAVKRKLIDRIIMQHEPSFGILFAQYEKAQQQRNKLLEMGQFNSRWSNILDPIILDSALKIFQIRDCVLRKIEKNFPADLQVFLGGFLKISMDVDFENLENFLKTGLAAGDFVGPHRTKFEISTQEYIGSFASTGQQKKLLLSFVISSLYETDASSILLLDDVLAHLDLSTQVELLEILRTRPFQSWISHTIPIDSAFNIKI